MKTLEIRRPDDFHVHFRQDELMYLVVPYTEAVFARALVMPNIRMPGVSAQGKKPPPVRTGEDAHWYRRRIRDACRLGVGTFEPMMTIAITDETTPKIIEEANLQGVIAGKIYPSGVTTHSEYGVSHLHSHRLRDVLSTMADVGMVCCVHAEKPESFVLDREADFIKILDFWLLNTLDLKLVIEHVSSAAMVQWIKNETETVGATVTAHHLMLTLDDVIGGMLSPHNFCKPIVKRPEDRAAIQQAVLSGDPKFFFGSDSAPYDVKHKESASGCAGIFSAPVALAILAEFFEAAEALDRLEPFVSELGARFYGLPLNEERIKLVRKPWKIERIHVSFSGPTVVPFCLGHIFNWGFETR